MKQKKSFAAHLTGIYVALEAEEDLAVNQAVQTWLSTNPEIEKPARLPEQSGNLTITFIHCAANADEHTERVREWAREVWSARREHHALAKQLIAEATSKNNRR